MSLSSKKAQQPRSLIHQPLPASTARTLLHDTNRPDPSPPPPAWGTAAHSPAFKAAIFLARQLTHLPGFPRQTNHHLQPQRKPGILNQTGRIHDVLLPTPTSRFSKALHRSCARAPQFDSGNPIGFQKRQNGRMDRIRPCGNADAVKGTVFYKRVSRLQK